MDHCILLLNNMDILLRNCWTVHSEVHCIKVSLSLGTIYDWTICVNDELCHLSSDLKLVFLPVCSQ